MCSDLHTGAGELVCWMVNVTSLTAGSVLSETSGGGSTVGVETCVKDKLLEVGRFLEKEREVW